MKPAFDLSTIRATLLRAVQNGRFTIEQLDRPSPGFTNCARVDRAHFQGGYQGVQHRNLLRDDQAPSQPHRQPSEDITTHRPKPPQDPCPF